MNTSKRLTTWFIAAAVVVVIVGTVVAGGDFVTAATAAVSTLLLLGVGVGIVKWLWTSSGRLGRGQIAVAAALLVLIAAVVGCLTGGGEWFATNVMATLTPTATVAPAALASEIEAQASAQEAAQLWIEIVYGREKTGREALKTSGGERLVLDMDISPNELKGITTTLGLTQTVAVVRNPATVTRYIRDSQSYAVEPLVDGAEVTHLGEVTLSPLVTVEVFYIPPIKIVDGDSKVIDETRIAYVVVHRVESAPEVEIARDTWVVAGMILTRVP